MSFVYPEIERSRWYADYVEELAQCMLPLCFVSPCEDLNNEGKAWFHFIDESGSKTVEGRIAIDLASLALKDRQSVSQQLQLEILRLARLSAGSNYRSSRTE